MTQAAPLTAQHLAGRPVAALAVPGSLMIDEDGIDEGVGHGFGGRDASALLRRWWRVRATGQEVLDWFAARLDEDGWTAARLEPGHAMFLRGREQLFVAVRSVEGASLVYESGYSDQSAP